MNLRPLLRHILPPNLINRLWAVDRRELNPPSNGELVDRPAGDARKREQPSAGAQALSIQELERLADNFPSMGGKEIGPFLRRIAKNAPPNTAIVEVGSWLGAGTAQLALGVRERQVGGQISIHSFDRWIATKGEVEKAKQKNNLDLELGQDTLPYVMDSLTPFGVHMYFTKGDILDATWGGQPISVYVDDASKAPKRFYHVMKTFGPSWIPGVTIVVLMDYHYWEKTGSADHKCQRNFIDNHREHFAPVEGFKRRGSNEAFLYTKQLDFQNLNYNSLLSVKDG